MAINLKGIKKYFYNTFWLTFEKFGRMSIGLFVTVLLARYLGPEQFGVFNYASSFVMLFSILHSLGLEKLLIRDFINKPSEKYSTLYSAFILQLIGGSILFLFSSSISLIANPNDYIVFYLVLIMSSAFILKSFNVIRYWFEAHVKAHIIAPVALISFTLSMFLQLIFIFSKASIFMFAWAIFAESFFLTIGLLFVFYKNNNKFNFCFKINWQKIRYLLNESWPLILAGGLYTIYTRIDQIMIGKISGNNFVGIYAAAIKISEGWSYIPVIISTSFFPAILNARKNNKKLYNERIQNLLSIMVLISFTVAIITTIFSKPIIDILYGSNYKLSSTVLSLHIWGGVFVAMSAVCFRVFIAENLQRYSLYRGITGLLVNIVLNIILIPKYGAIGAAIATIFSQASSLYFFNFFNSKTRFVFKMQTKAILFTNLAKIIRNKINLNEI